MKNLSEKGLLNLHMDCMFTYEKGRMVHVNEPWGSTALAPRLFVGRTVGGEIVYRFGRQADTAFQEKAEALLSQGIWDITEYRRELGADGGSLEKCFYYPTQAVSDASCRLLTVQDRALLADSFRECEEEIATAQPYAGYFRDGRIVSICRSVRKGQGHEAGIETLPEYRRQGCAQAVLKCWTAAVFRQGFVPLYSADADNGASLQLAGKAGYVMYAQAFEL